MTNANNNKPSIVIYTIQEAADILKVTVRSLRTWIKDGKIKAFRVGHELRITEESLREFINNGGTE